MGTLAARPARMALAQVSRGAGDLPPIIRTIYELGIAVAKLAPSLPQRVLRQFHGCTLWCCLVFRGGGGRKAAETFAGNCD